MFAAKRLQFSLEVKPIPEIEWMKSLPDVILPLFWVEEGVALGKEYTKKLKSQIYRSEHNTVELILFFSFSTYELIKCHYDSHVRVLHVMIFLKWVFFGLGAMGW